MIKANYQRSITKEFDIGDLNSVDWPFPEGNIFPRKK